MSPYYNPNERPIFSIFGIFYPVLLLANIGMVVFWLFVKFKYLFLSFITIILGWAHLEGFVNFPSASSKNGSIKVFSYNVSFANKFRSGPAKKQKQNEKSFLAFMNEYADADIFCIQETGAYVREKLRTILPDYHEHIIPKRGTYIRSKYPVVNGGEIPFGTKTNSCIWADLKIKNDTIRIYNMHLQSNKVTQDAVEVIENVNLQDQKTWTGIIGILNKYSHASKIRANQAQRIIAHADQSPYPTIIAGDANDPPTTFTYSAFSENYNDSFIEKGNGIGTTYGGRLPMLRIDYIFVEDQFEVNDFKIIKENYSDHYPVVGTYELR